MEKKIIFFDIDGTLLNHENKVPESTKVALAELKKEGHLRFVCTGRTKCMLPTAITELDFDGYVYGGGTAVEFHGKQVEFIELSQECIIEASKILMHYGASFLLEGQENVFLEEACLSDQRIYFSKFVKSLGELAKVIVDYEEVHASKITLLRPDITEKEFEAMREALVKDFSVIVHERAKSKVLTDGLIELVPHGCTKATGIKKTIEALDIPWEDTIGVGDSNNDLEMLDYVKMAVCMGNGSEKAKSLADFITKSIDEDGIMYAMEHLGLIAVSK